MKKKFLFLAVSVVLLVSLTFGLVACTSKESWDAKHYDTSLPDFSKVGKGEENANSDGWYEVFTDNFEGDTLNSDIWTYSPHAVRWETQKEGKENYSSYWCPDMVSVKDGKVEVLSEERTNHVCSSGKCPSVGRFTGGIETRRIKSADESQNTGEEDELLFSQAFGYFEAKVKFPKGNGMWSAFWLQSSNMRKVSNEGLDGTEIDIYESAFINEPTKMGHALLWDGYSTFGKVDDYILDTKTDLYDGYHTFGLKWTPNQYVFYIDGIPTWGSIGGGVSKVKEFLRLTVEIDAGDGYGPHGKKIGQFDKNSHEIFYVDYVKVYQNKNYTPYEMADDKFIGISL